MECAEQKKNKRVRHAYPRKEIYHRFIHSDEYAYSPAGNKQISCKGNYIVLRDIGKKATIEDIEELWYYNSNRMVAIIDRNLRRILINKTYSDHAWELVRAVPDYYSVYFTNYCIPDKDILKNKEKLYKVHAKYLIEQFVNYPLNYLYPVLNGKKKGTGVDINAITPDNFSSLKAIIKFVKDNKLKRYSFYKKCLNEQYSIKSYIGSNYYTIKVKLPTLQQIVNGTYFTKKEKTILEQHCFYKTYCYGEGIPFKDVIKYWKQEVTHNEFVEYCSKHNIYCRPECLTAFDWNTLLINTITSRREIDKKYLDAQFKQTELNREKAYAELQEKCNQIVNVNDWREGKVLNTRIKVEYRAYRKLHGKTYGWTTETLSSNCEFKNTQLRLRNDRVETSRGAVVPLRAAIMAFKLLRKCIDDYNKSGVIYFPFRNINVGIYSLINIQYTSKFADTISRNYEILNYKTWLVRIGCHNLWLDDIENFIRYYHLEKEFGLEVNIEINNNNN